MLNFPPLLLFSKSKHRHRYHPHRHWWWGKARRRHHYKRPGYRYGWDSPSSSSSSSEDHTLTKVIVEEEEEPLLECGTIAVILSDTNEDKVTCLEILTTGTEDEAGIPKEGGIEDEFAVEVSLQTECDEDDILCIELDEPITSEECELLLADVKTYLEDNLIEECQIEDEEE